MNGHCSTCPIEKDCGYEYKPCDCRDQMKFKPIPQPAQEPVANYCRECLTYNGHHEGCSHYSPLPAQQQEARIAQLEAELMRMQGRELKLQFALAEQQEPDAFVQREAIRTLSGGANHVPATLTLNDDGGKAVAVFLSPQPAPVQEPVGYEKYAAIREGHRNACEEAYFGARPDLPLATSTLTVFRHGFDRGYDLAAAAPQPAQWVNVVNHDNCYQDWNKEDAINHAVKMAEKYIAENVANGTSPPPPQRKPLTPQEFEALQYKVKGYVQTGLMDVVRMVEEHHNIKEQP